jgi:3-oxoacyl-[acyl-carrier protein] reductase
MNGPDDHMQPPGTHRGTPEGAPGGEPDGAPSSRGEGRLTRRVALVTGGSRGIGRAIVSRLASEGAAVAFTYGSRAADAEQLQEAVRQQGGLACAYKTDASDEQQMEEFVTSVRERWGRVDIAISSAGVMYDSPVEETPVTEWRRVIEVNLTGAFLLARRVIPLMKAQGSGRIINISSQAAFNGSANHAHYSASKAGLLGFTYATAKELGPYGITVNAVTPGRIRTDMVMERSQGRMEEWLAQIPMNRLGKAEEVAAVVAFLCSEDAAYVHGANITVAGGQLMG